MDTNTNMVQEAENRLRYKSIIKQLIPKLEEIYYLLPFEQVMVDSIDLLAIRVELEQTVGLIPDQDWVALNSINEIIDYCVEIKANKGTVKSADQDKNIVDQLTINMPQMAIEALSENWLFRELGNRHWQMLCNGINTSSGEIKDEEGNRLYATFVRIQIEGSASINAFKENDIVTVGQDIKRYGLGMYFSDIDFYSKNCNLRCKLMTSFSLRNNIDNTKLVKSQPSTAINSIPSVNEFPFFANEYRNIKKGLFDNYELSGYPFSINQEIIFETEYRINPYYELNGVGLLYFAAYPTINDNCEAGYFNIQYGATFRWESSSFTKCRDILYYANCNLNDTIIYRLHSIERLEDERLIKMYSSLCRKSDGNMLAQIFTIKSL